MKRWFPVDFVVALALVLAANALHCSSPGKQGLHRSFRFVAGLVDALEPEPPLDLLILGDSRSRRLDAQRWCDTWKRVRCINLSMMSGSWVTSFEIYRRIEPLLNEDSLIVLGVSDFWLEMGGRHPLGILPDSTAYAMLGDPLSTLESYTPMSRTRGDRMETLHRFLSGLALSVEKRITGRATPDPDAGLMQFVRASVDLWFRPIRPERRQQKIALARRTLERLTRGPAKLVVVYMPNPAVRDRYVETHYPGRRERFFREMRGLLDEFDVPFVDLAAQLPAANNYLDFHHLNPNGRPIVTDELARRIARIVPGASNERSPGAAGRR